MTVSVTTSVSGPPLSSSIITCKGKQFVLSSQLWLCLYVNVMFWQVSILTFTTFENQLEIFFFYHELCRTKAKLCVCVWN
jgi:hypothetical protein